MAGRINIHKVILKIHIYSIFVVSAFLLMYTITAFLLNRHKLLPLCDPEIISTTYTLNLPFGIKTEELPSFIQKEFQLRGQKAKPQLWDNGEISISYVRPGISFQAIIAADRNSVKIITTKPNARLIIRIFHRLKGYGGGFMYDLYVFMSDLTAVSIILISFTGIYLGLYNGEKIILKLMLLAIGLAYILLVVFSFLKS